MCWAEPLHLLGGSALVRGNNRHESVEVGTLGLEQIRELRAELDPECVVMGTLWTLHCIREAMGTV